MASSIVDGVIVGTKETWVWLEVTGDVVVQRSTTSWMLSRDWSSRCRANTESFECGCQRNEACLKWDKAVVVTVCWTQYEALELNLIVSFQVQHWHPDVDFCLIPLNLFTRLGPGLTWVNKTLCFNCSLILYEQNSCCKVPYMLLVCGSWVPQSSWLLLVRFYTGGSQHISSSSYNRSSLMHCCVITSRIALCCGVTWWVWNSYPSWNL